MMLRLRLFVLWAKSAFWPLGQKGFGPALAAVLILTAAGAVGNSHSYDHPIRDSSVTLKSPRIIILKSRRLLHLFDADQLVRTYAIDLGISPVGPKQHLGDGRTPIGSFRIITKNPNSPYHRFLGIDYPNEQTAASALRMGLISPEEAASIQAAVARGRCPDWTTALGGGIGLHGGRKGRDWTGGCIALSDEQINELFSVLRIGDPVEILP